MKHWAFFSTAALLACTEYDLKTQPEPQVEVYPEIEVYPEEIVFEQTPLGTSEDALITISNIGEGNLEISDLQLVGAGTFVITELADTRLLSGESQELVLTYTPMEDNASDRGSVLISSNDPSNYLVEVPLRATSTIIRTPELQISPLEIDFGTKRIGTLTTESLLLESVGDAPVVLNSYSLSSMSSPFVISTMEHWPLSLEPGESTIVDVTFAPNVGGVFSDTFTVDCDDPAVDQTATLIGVSDDTRPVAVCSVDPAQIQPNSNTSATWYGADSYDPNGAAITSYSWSLVSKPLGSRALMPFSVGANRPGFYPDLAGDYTARLIVINEFGAPSEPCEVTLEAVPGQGLWVQMSWTYSGDDMDLHMTYNNGSYTSTNDCYYGNCTGGGPDWGAVGVTGDNPSLDQDDIPGTGPENITMQSPSNATYRVVVHDYPGSIYQGANDVTVVIFLGGVQVWSDTRAISGEDTYTPFAEITYPGGVVTPL